MKSRKILFTVMIALLVSSFKMAVFAQDLSGYSAADITAVNNIIENNGLQGYEKDAPLTWDFVTFWKTNTSGEKYIFNINLSKKGLTGTLDVSGLGGLSSLKCEDNALTGLNVSGLTNITSIQCKGNNISSLDLTGMTELKTLQCNANSLEMLNLSGLSKLEDFRCFNNRGLTRLEGLNDCTNLETFSCGSCKIEKLDVTALVNLRELNCDSMDMTELTGLVNKTNLNRLNCSGNKLESLDLSGCTAMGTVFSNHNSLTEIKGLKDCTAMTNFRCDKNKLSSLDISGFSDLCSVRYDTNNLTEVTFKNGKLKIENGTGGNVYITEINPADNSASLTPSPSVGYVFDGYYTDPAMTEESRTEFAGNVLAGTTLYTKFSPIISNVIISDLPQNIIYKDTLELEITGMEVASGYSTVDAVYRWYEGENDLGSDLSNCTYTVNDINEHTISCDITLGGCKVTKTFTFTASPKTVNTQIILAAPVKNAVPQTSIDTDEYTATVLWSPEASSAFAKSTVYTATIEITPKTNYTTIGIAQNGYTLDGATTVENDENSNIVKAVFPKTSGSSSGSGSSRYTVSFDTNGGNRLQSRSVMRNSTVKEPAKPEKDGFVFDGWYTDKELKTKYNFSEKVTGNFVLYAGWVKEDVSVNQIILTIGDKTAQVFGKAKTNDVAPRIVNDRTMLPARFVAENLGAKVLWDGEKELVTITGKNLKTGSDVTILITIRAKTAVVNGEEVELDFPAFVENDRTYTPVRFISEELGASVEWIEKEQKVIITRN